jgi:hypothetical protein
MDNNEMLMVLERIASALEKQNQLMEIQELRQRKLDNATYESIKVDSKKVIKTVPRFNKEG